MSKKIKQKAVKEIIKVSDKEKIKVWLLTFVEKNFWKYIFFKGKYLLNDFKNEENFCKKFEKKWKIHEWKESQKSLQQFD